jgi:uncharacterized protein (DUF58 family)
MRSSARYLFLTLFAASLFGVLTTGAALYTRLAYFSALLLVGSWLWTFLALRGVSLTRRARSLRASVGDIFEENFEFQNKIVLPRLWLEIENRSRLPRASGSRVFTWIGGRQNRTYLARTWLTRRGAYPLGPTILRSGDPFGLFTVRRSLPPEDSLLVLPLILPLDDFPSPPGLLPGGRTIRQRSREVTPHASGVREYVTGDSLKSIHWPSTARRGKLMVKEFAQDPQAETWIFLDGQQSVHCSLPEQEEQAWHDWMLSRRPELSLPASTLEYGICAVASLAHFFVQKRRAVGFVTEERVLTVLSADRSERQEGKILETLAFVNGEGRLPLVSLVAAQAPLMPPGSSAILITPSASDEMLLAVETLLRRGIRPFAILIDTSTFGGYPGVDELAAKLGGRGVPVCLIKNKTKIGEVLSLFAKQTQESPLWRK